MKVKTGREAYGLLRHASNPATKRDFKVKIPKHEVARAVSKNLVQNTLSAALTLQCLFMLNGVMFIVSSPFTHAKKMVWLRKKRLISFALQASYFFVLITM